MFQALKSHTASVRVRVRVEVQFSVDSVTLMPYPIHIKFYEFVCMLQTECFYSILENSLLSNKSLFYARQTKLFFFHFSPAWMAWQRNIIKVFYVPHRFAVYNLVQHTSAHKQKSISRLRMLMKATIKSAMPLFS